MADSDLEAKLATYQAQLSQLDALLSQSNDAELQALRNDLAKLITITEDALKAKSASTSVPTVAGLLAAATSNAVPTPTAPSPSPVPATTLPGYATATASSSASFTAYGPVPSSAGAAQQYSVGQKVEGARQAGDGRTVWYPGVVATVPALGSASQLVGVRFIGVPGIPAAHVTLVDPSSLRNLSIPAGIGIISNAEVVPGSKWLVKWSQDGQYYAATVDAVPDLEHIYVTFIGYNNAEVVPKEYLQRMGKGAAIAASAASSSAAVAQPAIAGATGSGTSSSGYPAGAGSSSSTSSAMADHHGADNSGAGSDKDDDDDKNEDQSVYAGLVIPENLRSLPTDTEETRIRKRKKVKALKHQWKIRKQEETSAAKASLWQSFLNKGAKRPGGAGGGSMFRVGDGPGARVGVIGSGGGLTSFEQQKRMRTGL